MIAEQPNLDETSASMVGVDKTIKRSGEMGRIIVSENITVDGVVQDPTGEEGFRHGGWFGQVGSNDREAFGKAAFDEALAAEAFLMGRRTYEFLSSRWPLRSGALADRLNSFPKYVVSSTLGDPDWNNTTVMKGDPVAEVSKLKEELTGEIVVPASFRLAKTLIDHDLVDELRVMVYPFVLGDGERLFSGITNKVALRVVDNRTLGHDLTYVTYEVTRAV
jgi:dihydrofolate reductase